ncbi:MAG: structural protein P5 [Paludibacteraceae bacterium]|nr:structural protein P5 [Paludibacteraceae bacterium]
MHAELSPLSHSSSGCLQPSSEKHPATATPPTPTRGIRNNNPLNIRISPDNKWLGKVTPNTDGSFEQFRTMQHGVRAAWKLILNYYDRHGLHTINSIVARFAPPSENNTANYIATLIRLTGKGGNETLRRSELPQILYAMALIESGPQVRMYKQLFTNLKP